MKYEVWCHYSAPGPTPDWLGTFPNRPMAVIWSELYKQFSPDPYVTYEIREVSDV